jgi:hypothetical protein
LSVRSRAWAGLSRFMDGRTCREGGPKRANDCKGLGVPANAIFYDNGDAVVKPPVAHPALDRPGFCGCVRGFAGMMCVAPKASISPLRHYMSPSQQLRCELLWDCMSRRSNRGDWLSEGAPLRFAAVLTVLGSSMVAQMATIIGRSASEREGAGWGGVRGMSRAGCGRCRHARETGCDFRRHALCGRGSYYYGRVACKSRKTLKLENAPLYALRPWPLAGRLRAVSCFTVILHCLSWIMLITIVRV